MRSQTRRPKRAKKQGRHLYCYTAPTRLRFLLFGRGLERALTLPGFPQPPSPPAGDVSHSTPARAPPSIPVGLSWSVASVDAPWRPFTPRGGWSLSPDDFVPVPLPQASVSEARRPSVSTTSSVRGVPRIDLSLEYSRLSWTTFSGARPCFPSWLPASCSS